MSYFKKWFKNTVTNICVKLKGLKDIGSWKGSVVALGATVLFLFIIQSYHMFFSHGGASFIKGFMILLSAMVLLTGVLTLIIAILRRIPILYIWVGLSSFFLLCITFLSSHIYVTLIFIILLIVVTSLIGNIVYRIIKNYSKDKKLGIKLLYVFLIILMISSVSLGSYWLLNDGTNKNSYKTVMNMVNTHEYILDADDPSEIGEYTVNKIFYGSGTDLHRKEYGKEVKLLTSSVDGSGFVDNWSGLRRRYLGFGPEEMPLNAKVYYPEGEGPFPLVIIAHGNHLMTDYSDTGYDYLGNLLASRGYIFVSVDHNFLNLSVYDDIISLKMLNGENDARGWLLLQHISQWDKWNRDKDSFFYNKVDMNNIGLIGHSRGGEATAIAAFFNKLNTYPDNGNITFDFNYNIKSIIAIAPTDGQYNPIDKAIELTDINYLVLHGAHDMDVSTFAGTNQYNRISFKEKENYFKSSVYIYGANHGQFNENWGRRDGIGLGNFLNNIKQLMPKEDQERIAKVFISGFLDATLKEKDEYRILFSDIRYAKNLLPETMYISNYLDGKTTIIANFDEDIDINSTTIPEGYVFGENFTEWKEGKIKRKNGLRDNSSLYLSWDSSENKEPGTYTIKLPHRDLDTNENSLIVFSIADGDMSRSKKEDLPIDLTIRVIDLEGNEARLPLSSFMALNPSFRGEIFKAPFANMLNTREPVFQNFRFKLEDFTSVNNNFDPKELSEISFIFDITNKGTILIDDIGITLSN